MSIRNRTATVLAPGAMSSPRVEDTQQQNAGLRDGDDSEAISIFDRAVVDVMHARECKAEEVAAHLGVSYQNLSDFRNGKRVIAFHRILRLVTTDPDVAARTIIGALCEMAGYEPPRKRRRLGKGDVKRQLEMELKKQPALVELFLEKVASAFGTDVEEVKDAWAESTDVRRFDTE